MEANRTYSLYRHISPSGKVYVGITSMAPTKRWGPSGALYYGKNEYPFSRAIKKYGWNSIKHEVLFSDIDEAKAKRFEMHLIAFYKMLGISYNITNGGESGFGNKSHLGQKASDETKQKMSASASHVVYQYTKDGLFVKKWNSQKEAAEALNIFRRSISAANCGRTHLAGGFHWSSLPPGEWQKPARRHTESGRKKKIYQFSIDGKLISWWNSVTEASEDTGFCLSQIASACNRNEKSNGYFWSYSPEIEIKKIEAQKQIAKSRGTGVKK